MTTNRRDGILVSIALACLVVLIANDVWGWWKAAHPTRPAPPPPPIRWWPVGTLVSITPVPTSFNEAAKAQVETTKGSFIVYGLPSGVHGTNVVLSSTGQLGLAGYKHAFVLVWTPGRTEEMADLADG